MTSTRHNLLGDTVLMDVPAVNPFAANQAYLDAARAALLDLGWSRTTLTEIARRAGVSRMTLYRTWPDMNSLLGDLMTREWTDVLMVSEAADYRTRIVESVLGTVKSLRSNEMFARIMELDPERLLPYLLERTGRVQDLLIAFLAEAIGEGQGVGQIRSGEPGLIASAILLQAQGFALSAQVLAPTGTRLNDLDHEFADALMRYLAP